MKAHSFKLFFFISVLAINCSITFSQYTWTKFGGNPLNLNGASGSWDQDVGVPYVIFNSDSSRYEMWYSSFFQDNAKIGFAVSSDGIVWTKYPNPVLSPSSTGWDSLCVAVASVLRENGQYKMWYTGWKNSNRLPQSIGYATSPNGIDWTKHGAPVLGLGTQAWENAAASYCSVIRVNGSYKMFYTGTTSIQTRIGRAFSSDGINWQRDTLNNPVLNIGTPGQWDQQVYLPKVIALGNTFYLWYTAETVPHSGNSDIGLATSVDSGKTWTKYAENPVLKRQTGGWDNLWIETGSILLKDNTFYMWYDGGGAAPLYLDRIGLATSPFIPVPVELTSFTVTKNGKGITLSWSTATEINNLGFEVQRKFNDGEFAVIGSVKGQGTTTNPKQYSFVDKNLTEGKYSYRLKQMDYDGKFNYSATIEFDVRVLDKYTLEQNYPNPFNPTTTIGYVLQEKSNTKLTMLNTIGEEIAVLVNEEQDKGYHKVEFDGSKLSSGVYFYRLQAGSFIETKKMILLK